MKCEKLSSDIDVFKLINHIGSSKEGASIMAKKAKKSFLHVKQIKTPAANILKQEALSLGADFAVPKGVIVCEEEFVDGLLMIDDVKIEPLIKKLKTQPFGLKALADELKKHQKNYVYKPKIMGVVNTNEDSFFSGSRFEGKNAINHISNMINDGADMIDVGGVSSRPGSEGVSLKEELKRVKPVIDEIYKSKLYENAIFSLDSYSPLCLEYAFDRGFKIANDITALSDDEVAKVCAEYKATVCLMHMQKDPKSMQKNPHYESVISEIDEFFSQRIKKAENFGIEDIILDVGIGFGKDLHHNLSLIKHQAHFLHFGYELLVGASRKSLINKVVKCDIGERLPGTLILHVEALRQGASIIRCHDVKEHFQAIKIYEALKETL